MCNKEYKKEYINIIIVVLFNFGGAIVKYQVNH